MTELPAPVASLLGRCTFGDEAELHLAVSGGADSMAMLALACAGDATVVAHHVDHQLRPGSTAEADIVAGAAERFGARFVGHTITVEPGPNLEERARNGRREVLPRGVATGHTADDQAETVLLALMRGSGWQGLAGMNPGPDKPILGLRRAETVQLCDALGVEPVLDPSNTDPAIRRNRVRAELIPLLNEIAQRDVVPVLTRQTELFREGSELVQTLADQLDPTDAKALAAADRLVARQAVREWLWSSQGGPHPPTLATVDRVLGVARLEAVATEIEGGCRVERSGQRLRIVPIVPNPRNRN